MATVHSDPAPNCLPSLFKYELPPELERKIGEIAVYNFPKSVPNLILVAHRFRIWFEPELYRTIRCGKQGTIFPPLFATTSPRSTNDNESTGPLVNKSRIQELGVHVRIILIEHCITDEVLSLFEFCPNVSNLGVSVDEGSCAPLIPILEKLQLRKLCFDPAYFFGYDSMDFTVPFNQPMFLNLTHLEIINPVNDLLEHPDYSQIAHLTKLTNLVFTQILSLKYFFSLVEHYPKSMKTTTMLYHSLDYLSEVITYMSLECLTGKGIEFLQTNSRESQTSLKYWKKLSR